MCRLRHRVVPGREWPGGVHPVHGRSLRYVEKTLVTVMISVYTAVARLTFTLRSKHLLHHSPFTPGPDTATQLHKLWLLSFETR